MQEQKGTKMTLVGPSRAQERRLWGHADAPGAREPHRLLSEIHITMYTGDGMLSETEARDGHSTSSRLLLATSTVIF